MKWLFIIALLSTAIGCRYNEPKATFSIAEVDTIAIEKTVLEQP